MFGMYQSYTWNTGWRRLIGSPKLQIIFHKRATKYRALLRKMTYKDKGSYESSPPCTPRVKIRVKYTECKNVLCVCVAWLNNMCDVTDSYVWPVSVIYVTWHIDVCCMSHSCVWHDSFMWATWNIDVCDITQPAQVEQVDPFMCVTWLIHMCGRAHSHVRHDSSDRSRETRHIYRCEVTYSYGWQDRFTYGVASFAKEPYKRDNILQKRPII